jgi:hypothetical protein
MSSKKYIQITQRTVRSFSAWERLPRRYLQACCGCGLVHEWRFSWGRYGNQTVMGKTIRVHKGDTRKEKIRMAKKWR